MKRPLLFSLIALLAVSSTAAVYFYRENLRLRQQLADTGRPAEHAAARAVANTTDAPVSPRSEVADAANVGVDSSNVSPEERRENVRAQRFGDRRNRGQETMARMLTDPAMREAMLTRMKGQVDRQFGDLFVRLGLNEDQAEVLRTLLAERQLARMQSNFLGRSSGEDEQARLEAENWQEREEATIEAGIEAILGPDGMETLREYQRTSGERQVVANISQRASYMGAPLDAAASDQLVNLFAAAEEKYPVSRNPALPRRGADAAPLTQQSLNQYLGELQTRNQAVLTEAKAFLAPAQVEALAAQQLEQYEQTAAQLDFQLRNPDISGRGGDFRFEGRGGPGGR